MCVLCNSSLNSVAVYGLTQVLFPRSVTEEQEAYARGFLDALVELQRQRQQAAASPLVQVGIYHHQSFKYGLQYTGTFLVFLAIFVR